MRDWLARVGLIGGLAVVVGFCAAVAMPRAAQDPPVARTPDADREPPPAAKSLRPLLARELDDPPGREEIAEFVFGESGGLAPRKGTAWRVQYARGLHKGLYITGAWFKRDLDEDWIKILEDARIADFFVPYHQSSYIRFYDLTGFSFPLAQVRGEDAGAFGSVLPAFQGDRYPTVIKEVRDRGVVWKDFANGVRRGRELVLWAGLEAGNYMYLMQYGFQDDGTITFRAGATGQNLPGARRQAHMHNTYWRIDIDLVDPKMNSAMVMRHLEKTGEAGAEDLKEPFNGGLEGGIEWDPKEFTMVRVESEKRNAGGKRIAYDLMPIRMGSSRHQEEFSRHDLYVSRSHPERPTEMIYANLPDIVKDQEVVEQADVVLWCNSSSHHEPRDEDGKEGMGQSYWPGDDAWAGSAVVMWSGFDLRPRNLFDRTPFYPYPDRPRAPARVPVAADAQ
jgi:primary-amine oxidase